MRSRVAAASRETGASFDDLIKFNSLTREMAEFLRDQKLRTQAIPEQLELVDAVPRNPSGKILKHKLREQYAAS